MTLRAIDCQGFAGGMTLGVVQSGWELTAKREMMGGFGAPNCLANKELLGHGWDYEEAPFNEWTPKDTEMVFGNPPCSGFSALSSKEFRGMESKINQCMHALIDYAARCNPEIVVFESVATAYNQGRPLMQQLRWELEQKTGKSWYLTHVKHNALSLGGAAMRKRYFFVASLRPFSVDYPRVNRVPTLNEVIGDLAKLEQTMDYQTYDDAVPSWWAKPKQAENGMVDGHVGLSNASTERVLALLEDDPWPEGEDIRMVATRVDEKTGTLRLFRDEQVEKLRGNGYAFGFYAPHRWKGESHARVITGAAMAVIVHPTEQRLLTHRECARIMGFPDDWVISTIPTRGLHATWGKGITVECGRWIGEQAQRNVNGGAGDYAGEVIGEKETLIDVTYAYRDGARPQEVPA